MNLGISTDRKSLNPKSPSYYPIKELTTWTTKWTIQGRIVEKSSITQLNRDGRSLQVGGVNIMDKLGDSIRAVFWGEAAQKWLPLLEEKKVYTFGNGRVQIANKRYSVLPHQYELVFDTDAAIAEAPVAHEQQQQNQFSAIPMHRKSNITKLRDLSSSCRSLPFIVDLCVVVTWLSPSADNRPLQDGNSFLRRSATVCDDTGYEIALTLWDSHAVNEELIQAYEQRSSDHPVVLVIHNAQIREFRGRIASTMRGSYLIVNPSDDAMVNDLRVWFRDVGSRTELGKLTESSQIGESSQTGNQVLQLCVLTEAFDKLQNLENGDQGSSGETIIIIAQPMKIFYASRTGETNLTFTACNKCNRKCNLDNGNCRCDFCDEDVANPVERYLFSLQLVDASGSAFTARCFDGPAQAVLGISAEEIRKWVPRKSGVNDVTNEGKLLLEYGALWHPFRFRIRMKVEMYNGEQRKNVTISTAERLNAAADGRRMLNVIANLLPNYIPFQYLRKRPQSTNSETQSNTETEDENEKVAQQRKRAKMVSTKEDEENKENVKSTPETKNHN